MSTIFESEVYHMRRTVPFAQPKALAFMSEKASLEDHPVILTVQSRGRVASRLWWTLEWHEEGQRFSVESQEWDLLFWRAIQKHKENERRFQLEHGPVSKGPGFYGQELRGWQGGEGI
jgi:hypothetical protein